MKKFITKFCVILFAPLVFASSTSAAYLNYWFDPTGSGTLANAVNVNEYLDYTGSVYAQNTYTSDTGFDLSQYGYAKITGHDGLPNTPGSSAEILNNAQIFASYSGGGNGDLSTNAISFTDGTINLFTPGFDGTNIASFNITGGGGVINDLGAPNGSSTLNAVATSILAGYFFVNDNGALGQDLSQLVSGGEVVFGFATSNLSLVADNTVPAVHDILDSAFPEVAFVQNTQDGNGRYTNLTSASNGQWRMEVDSAEVPEPGILSLVGLAFLLMGVMARRQIN